MSETQRYSDDCVFEGNSTMYFEGIGKVISHHRSDHMVTLEALEDAAVDESHPLREVIVNDFRCDDPEIVVDEVEAAINNLLNAETLEGNPYLIVTDVKTLRLLFNSNDFQWLEQRGIIASVYSTDYPQGTYALDRFALSDSLSRLVRSEHDIDDFDEDAPIVLNGLFRRAIGKIDKELVDDNGIVLPPFSIHTTKPSKPKTHEELEKAGFRDVSTTGHAIALCHKDTDENYVWEPTQVYPDNMAIEHQFLLGTHYGGSVFEGSVAMVDSEGNISGFRWEENAKRFQQSCIALGIPPVTMEQYMDAVMASVRANMDYLPEPGTKDKLYIRPYMVGLDGGNGVGHANHYKFGVLVYPFGEYIAKREDVVNVVHVPDQMRAAPGQAANKLSCNYPSSIPAKYKAKHGELEPYRGKNFDEIAYSSPTLVIGPDGEERRQEVMDEAGSSNLFFVNIDEESKQIIVSTPSLDRKTILPGITRDAMLKLAPGLDLEALGLDEYEIVVQEKDITFNDVRDQDMAFQTGSAAGAVRIGTFTFVNEKGVQETVQFDAHDEHSPNATTATKIFFALYDRLYAARQGKLEGFEQWANGVGNVHDRLAV